MAREARSDPLKDAHRPKGNNRSSRTVTRGTTRDYILKRLARDRKDLLAKVEAGDCSEAVPKESK